GRRPPSDTSVSSAELLDELDLLERGLPVRELQVGLVDDRVRREVGGGAVLAVALAGVVVVSTSRAGVVVASASVVGVGRHRVRAADVVASAAAPAVVAVVVVVALVVVVVALVVVV